MPAGLKQAGSMSRLADALLGGGAGRDDVVDRYAMSAVEVFDSVDFASIVLFRRGDLATLVATDEMARKLDATQAELRDGPCLDVTAETHCILSSDLEYDTRWPRFGQRAACLGVNAQLSHRLHDVGGRHAVLNLYTCRPGTIGIEPAHLDAFAALGSLTLAYSHDTATLTEALRTRTMIGQAIGVVMARYGLTSGRAFAYLKRQSMNGHLKLRQVCANLVEEADRAQPAASDGAGTVGSGGGSSAPSPPPSPHDGEPRAAR
jgi:hypothetical protein